MAEHKDDAVERDLARRMKQNLARRLRAWERLKSLDLNDCAKFHREIEEMQWHFKQPKVDLQTTWRPLLLLLMTYLGKLDGLKGSQKEITEGSREILRHYQKDRWGMLDGETCVIELSGLAAPNAELALDTRAFLPGRIEHIRGRIRQHRPRLVVMYGLTQSKSYEQIAGLSFPDPDRFFCSGPSLLVLTPHPAAPSKEGNAYWTRLGSKLRNHRCIPG